MIRIVHIIKATGVVAGAEKHLLSLLPAMDRRQFDIRLLALTEPGSSIADLVSGMLDRGVRVERMTLLGDADLTLIPRLVYRLWQMRPHLVHTHLVHADLYGAVAARLVGVPLLISSRHNDDPLRRSGVVARLIKLANRYVDHFLAISDHVLTFTVDVEGVAPERVSTIHYGLQPRAPERVPDVRQTFGLGHGPLVVCVARLTPQKGHHMLLAAFRSVVQRIPDAQLLLIGDGQLRAELEILTQELGLENSVVFTGWRTDSEHLLYGVDLFVLPSLWEGFGLVLLEAMAASLAIVATRVGPIPEIVLDGHTGLLVEAGDEDNLVQSIFSLLESPHERLRLGSQGRKRLESEFSSNRMIDATEAVYLRLLSTKKQFTSTPSENSGSVSEGTIT